MTERPIERVLARVEQVRRSGAGWTARCPAHEDRSPSLSIAEGGAGQVLLKCHAGCTLEAVVAALGLTMGELFEEGRQGSAPAGAIQPPTAYKSVASERSPSAGRIVATYDYCDEAGTLLYQVVRFAPKGFRQRRPIGRREGRSGEGATAGHGAASSPSSSAWRWRLDDTRRVLYRLPELVAAPAAATVWVVEGEKDADRLARLGLVATCNPGGAGKWRVEYDAMLAGRRVVILPDNDAVGEDHAITVADALCAVAAEVRILPLPELPLNGDVSDWLDAGGPSSNWWPWPRRHPMCWLTGLTGLTAISQLGAIL